MFNKQKFVCACGRRGGVHSAEWSSRRSRGHWGLLADLFVAAMSTGGDLGDAHGDVPTG